ncbi:hypothetical protein MYO4S_00134 [Serratia phage 4S]|nr:hypothetical protein MYO4S_00134 [Serratia phage 4S]
MQISLSDMQRLVTMISTAQQAGFMYGVVCSNDNPSEEATAKAVTNCRETQKNIIEFVKSL